MPSATDAPSTGPCMADGVRPHTHHPMCLSSQLPLRFTPSPGCLVSPLPPRAEDRDLGTRLTVSRKRLEGDQKRHTDLKARRFAVDQRRHHPRALRQLRPLRRHTGSRPGTAAGRWRGRRTRCRASPARWPVPSGRPRSSSAGRTRAGSGAPGRRRRSGAAATAPERRRQRPSTAG